jgi:Carboxypeptidase regulatory-like domain
VSLWFKGEQDMGVDFKTIRLSRLNISFSKVQAIVGLTAGILSITGALVAFFTPAPDKGKLVAIVQDAKTDKAVSAATIEILTPMDVLVTTLKANRSGEAQYSLDEGRYRLRVIHPRYQSEVREVKLVSSQSTEVHVQLRTGRSFGNALRKVIGH